MLVGLFLLILGIFMIKVTYSPSRTFITNGNGWYNASSYGLNTSSPRIRMKFATDVDAPTVFTLFAIPTTLKGSGYIFTIARNNVLLSRIHLTNSKVFSINTELSLNDGKWHDIDVLLSINSVDIKIDNKKFPQIIDSENTLPIDAPYVSLGGFSDGYSLTGKIKDIYFGNQQKNDMIYVERSSPAPK